MAEILMKIPLLKINFIANGRLYILNISENATNINKLAINTAER